MSSDKHLNYDRRTCPRKDFHQECEFSCAPADEHPGRKAVTINISETGLCLYLFSPLEVGQEIKIRGSLQGVPRKGHICWIKKLSENVFKAGLRFSNIW